MANYPSPDPSSESEESRTDVHIIPTSHNEQPFCCDQIYPIKHPKSDNEKCIWYFIDLIKTHSAFTKWVQKYPASLFVDCWLCDTDIIIQYENYEAAEKVESRYFFQRPDAETFEFVEMKPGMVNWGVWKQNWESVKFRCDEHVGDRHWWSVRLLERIDYDAEKNEILAVKRTRRPDPTLDMEWERISAEEQNQYGDGMEREGDDSLKNGASICH